MKVKQLLTRTAGALSVTAGLLFVGSPLMAQVKIGDNPNSINPNSILELESTTKGFLQPRVALTSLTDPAPLTAHVAGMRVFNTAATSDLELGEYYNDGTSWVKLVTAVPESMQTFGSGAPSGGCSSGVMYTDTLETSSTVGLQWTCVGGSWVSYKAPNSTPFYLTGTANDAGSNKLSSVFRNGAIISARREGTGRSTIHAGGIIQLFRSPALGGNFGGSIDFSNSAAQPSLYRIGVRNDAGPAGGTGLAFQQGTSIQMVIGSNGSVGIGTHTPTRPLHVVGAIHAGAHGNDATGYATAESPSNGTMLVYASGTNRAQIINQSSGEDPNMILTRRGAVNNGDVFVRFGTTNITNLGAIVRNGSNVAFAATSDRRLKENIKNTHFTISDLMKVGVVDYNYISDQAKTATTGFIAQDLYKIYPDAVIKGGDDAKNKPWLVDYSKITPLLVKAVQDQQKKIELLEAQLSEMNALKAEVASIKAMLGNAAQQNSETIISK
ncbi:tail fiber domain-containing protein [Dyadobacter aurulentus]|uniref:tail fiber domain-containing protein n=1 Tax=Dyadobacter sp. UC 10 TaxID=2605428 RepID=UPI0011F24025|nr:tail fiber domain-containing protein [Dyadobacter sp. UC 10]KAA0993382.1 tail fiber domain-containing protein [Dyadobacter sp. UC 10]